MQKTMLTVFVMALVAGAVAASSFLQPRIASATVAEMSASISPLTLHRTLDAQHAPVKDVADYTFVFPER
jgi:hypothetical protein